MTIHQRKVHPSFVEDCFGCKLTTIQMSSADFTMEREGKDVTGGQGTSAYVKRMYESARANGKADPVPMNDEAAKYAPAAGVLGNTKKYKAANNGL